MKIMRFFIALSVLVCVAVAKPPRRSCPGRGNPNGYGPCASEMPYCDVGFTCENGVCCRSNDFNKPRVCPIGKPLGYGQCDNEGNCPGDLECIDDICCKIPKERVCPAGKPDGFGFCEEDDDCENSNQYCYDTEEGVKVCCEDEDSSSEEEEEPVCQVGNPLGHGNCDENSPCANPDHECQTTSSGAQVCCETEVVECPSNPCENFVCADPSLPISGPVCSFDTITCKATVTYNENDVTSQCLPDNAM